MRCLYQCRVATLSVAFALAAPVVAAQHALFPLDDIGYTYIDALQARGWLRDLPIVERPYAIGAIRAAVAAARERHPRDGTSRWLNELLDAVNKYAPFASITDTTMLFASLGGWGAARTSHTDDVMESVGRRSYLPGLTGRVLVQTPYISAVLRMGTPVRNDVGAAPITHRAQRFRAEDAYLDISSRFATLQIGRVGRSWALPGQLGLTLSNASATYDHVYVRLGTPRVHLSSLFARLDDQPVSFTSDTLAHRYFTAHRLSFRVGNFETALNETVIYGGIGRAFSPALSNPTAALFLAQYSEGEKINPALGLDALWHAPHGMLFGSQIFIDDFQIDRCKYCGKPPGIGVTVTADGVLLPGAARLFAAYTRVTTLTYRNTDRFEGYYSRGTSLGQRTIDFDEFRGGIDVGPALRAPMRLYVALRRQGAGSIFSPYPPLEAYNTWPTIFEGVTIKTVRVALSGALRIASTLEVQGDAGINQSLNDARIIGATRTRFEGHLRAAFEPQWGRGRLRIE